MDVPITPEILTALQSLEHVPDGLQARIDAVATTGDGAFTLRLADDDAMALAELVQWHMRTDPATGKPTAMSAACSELIRRIDEAQF